MYVFMEDPGHQRAPDWLKKIIKVNILIWCKDNFLLSIIFHAAEQVRVHLIASIVMHNGTCGW